MRVLDAGIWRPMPYATQLLCDLGADVLKLEPPGGDPMRSFPDLFRDVASNKRSVAVDLRTDAGRARARELAAEVDVFCEGWRPGVAARLGVGYDDLRAVNPSIVYCSLSGYGQEGPFATRPGHDVNYQALAGALARPVGDETPPEIPRLPVADLAAGAVAALTICAAWTKQQRTGEGEYVDVAMADVVASWVGPHDGAAIADLDERPRGSAGYGVFACADGEHVALGVIAEDHFWTAVCDVLGLAELRTLGHRERLRRVPECNAAVAAAIATRTRADVLAALVAAGAPVSPVLSPTEMGADAHFRARGVIVDDGGHARVGFPATLRVHPARRPGPAPARPDEPNS
jgi:crotonobetainyl-CoA:carnitine CoA-transferase CaiB-like acyl-CoA transferase